MSLGHQQDRRRGRTERRMRLAAVAFGVALSASGCEMFAPNVHPNEVFFPKAFGRNAVLLPLGGGTLTFEDGCLWARSGLERHLLIWPPSYDLALKDGRLAIVNLSERELARVGDAVQLTGSDPDEWNAPVQTDLAVEAVIGEPIPLPCRQGSYWNIDTIVRE
jgi:hypothetical protein